MPAERWLGDVGDLRSDPVVDVFVDRANATGSLDQGHYNANWAHMLDGAWPTDPARYVATAGPA